MRFTFSSQFTSHQASEENGESLHHGSKKAKAYERSSENSESDPSKERSDRRIDNVAPSQMARIVNHREFIAVETVSITSEKVNDDRGDGDIRQPRRIARPTSAS